MRGYSERQAVRQRLLLAGVATAGLVAAAPVWAQTASDDENTIGEVVVTAQLREQRLEEVPISVSVVSGETLDRQAITDTKSLAQFSPSLNFQYGASAGQSAISLRGVASVQQGSGGIQPSVALVVDGVPIQRQGEFSADLLADVQRVEVLGGPQGTLFGKNATAGVVSITTHRPKREFEAWVKAGATTDEEYSLSAMVNAPLTDAAQLRIMGFYRDQNPITKNFGPGNDVTGLESYGFTAKLNFDFSENYSLLLFGGYNHIDTTYNENIAVNPGSFGATQVAALGYTPRRGQDFINNDAPTQEYIKAWNVGAQFDATLNESMKWVTIASYRDYKNDNILDSDITPYGVVKGQGFSPGSLGYPFLFVDVGLPRRPDHQYYWSLESRVHYDRGAVQAVAGVFYQDFRELFSGNTPFLVRNANPCGPTGLSCYIYTTNIATNSLQDRTLSAFGDVTVALSEQWKVFGGLRFTHENLDDTYYRVGFNNVAAGFFDPVTSTNRAPPSAVVGPIFARTKVDNLSGRIGIQFQPSDGFNYYASFAKGYKGPGADFGNTVTRAEQLLVKPETATSFELGAKQRLFDDRLSIDVAIYHQEIKDIQVSAPQGGVVPQTLLVNAGDIKLDGVEGSLRWKVGSGLTLGADVAYVDSRFGDFVFGCYAPTQPGCGPQPGFPGNNQNLKGKRTPSSPKLKYSLSADYAGDFGADSFSYVASVRFTHQSSILQSINQDPLTIEPSHGFLDASVKFTSPDKKWDVVVFGKNLTDEFYYSNLTSAASLALPIGRLPRDYARYGGVILTYRW